MSHRTHNIIEVWQALDENNFTLAESWEVPEAAAVVVADFNGDGAMDIAFGSYVDSSVTKAYGFGDFSFVVDNDNSIIVDVSPRFLSAFNPCDNSQFPDLLVGNSSKATIMYVEDPSFNSVVTLVTQPFEIPDCPEGMAAANPCNNYTEPNCNPDPAFTGIQECLRATECRGAKCAWAACIEYEDGGLFRGALYIAQYTACAAVAAVEAMSCIPDTILRR